MRKQLVEAWPNWDSVPIYGDGEKACFYTHITDGPKNMQDRVVQVCLNRYQREKLAQNLAATDGKAPVKGVLGWQFPEKKSDDND